MDQKEYHDQLLSRNYDTLKKIERIQNSPWRKFCAWWRRKREEWSKWWAKK